MTDYDIYVFILCFIVFVMLTTLSVICISIITRLSIRLIHSGAEDERIIKDHNKRKLNKKSKKFAKIADCIISCTVCLVFVAMLIGSLTIRCTESYKCNKLPLYRVVKTASMEKKHANNKYLFENKLDNQIAAFDLIRTEALPDEMELELYDIVVYETDDMLLVHRIVEIEEPNAEHPDCRHFRLQGDAVDAPDRFPVTYKQMRAIYRGERTPFIGSFIMFMQSPAGWLCTLLIVIAMIAAPILDKKLETARKARLEICLKAEESAPALMGGSANA